MDFTALRYFSETAHSRSIRAASERLHVSPSAISRRISKLEHKLRALIFDRRTQGMILTPAGEILQSKVEGVIREFSRVKSLSRRYRISRLERSTFIVSRPRSKASLRQCCIAFMCNIRMSPSTCG
jgi:DNA-binding transcriptional LysR family regulator